MAWNHKKQNHEQEEITYESFEDGLEIKDVTRHDAVQSFQFGEEERNRLKDEVLDEIYSQINVASRTGKTYVIVKLKNSIYECVIDFVINTLKDNGYNVSSELIQDHDVAGNVIKQFIACYLNISWDILKDKSEE